MKIAHVSDNHSTFPIIPNEADIIVHSGDWLPNISRGRLDIEPRHQEAWIKQNIEKIKNWIGKKPFLFSPGNHDFFPPCGLLRQHGIEAYDITDRVFQYAGKRFFGFPYISYIAGEWAYESQPDEMARHIRRLKDYFIDDGIDILVAHEPPYGVLDCLIAARNSSGVVTYCEQHRGNRQLSNLFSYVLDEDKFPSHILSGHYHGHYGISEEWGITISNAATTVNLLEV